MGREREGAVWRGDRTRVSQQEDAEIIGIIGSIGKALLRAGFSYYR